MRRNVEREEGASSLSRPFGRPSHSHSRTLLVLVRCLSRVSHQSFRGPLPAQSYGKERAQSREKTGTTHNVSIVSFKRVVLTAIIVNCGFSLCPLNPEESRTENKKNPKM